MILPQPEFPPRDPVLEARCQRLKAEQEEREYKKMTANVDAKVQGLCKYDKDESFSKQSKKQKGVRVQKLLKTIKRKIKSPYYPFLLQ